MDNLLSFIFSVLSDFLSWRERKRQEETDKRRQEETRGDRQDEARKGKRRQEEARGNLKGRDTA